MPKELDRPPFFLLLLKVSDGREQHTARTASRIVNRFVWFRLEQFGHQMDDRTVRIELGGSVSRVVCELLDEVFVTDAEFIFGTVSD